MLYRSHVGFVGHDSFAFRIVSQDGRVATVSMDVTVKAPEGIPVPASGPIRLLEYTPWLIENRGPEKAVGAFFYMRGFAPDTRDSDRHRVPQYYIKSLAEAGWDIFYAKYPEELAYPGHEDAHKRVAEFARERVNELRHAGYRRVIAGGRSWGAWVAMTAAQNGGLDADALVLTAPATHGKRTLSSGKPNLWFERNRTEFATLLKGIDKPMLVIFFNGDEFDPGGRAKLVEDHVRSRQLAYLLIDNPPGFNGHFSDWMPIFDYIYGKCIEAFFDTLHSQSCERPALSAYDFRSILQRDQIADFEEKRVAAADELIGRTYVIYTSQARSSEVTYVSAQSYVQQRANQRIEGRHAFKDGQHCRSDLCVTLVRWDEKRIIAFDPKTGATTSWWIEKQGE